jgi:hypothetical protein
MAFLVLLLLCGYSLAQELVPEAFQEEIQQQEQQVPKAQILSPQEIPQGFASQIKAAQQAQEETPVEPLKEEKIIEIPQQKTGYYSYEAYLDSIELTAKLLLPARLRLDSMKYVINSETQAPMGQYEKQANYEKRIANAEKGKQLRIANLEKLHNAQEKKVMDKLTATIRLSKDIQPEWDSMLQENEKEAGEYLKRIDKFKGKISDMNVMSARINSLLTKLNVSQSDVEALEKKNLLYIKRMERACELMQDYMLKEETKVLSTERKKFEMTLSNYNVEKEELQVNVKDINSIVPFDYHGIIKIKPRLAEEIDNETDGFTASIDYINYPFIVDGAKAYPGAKKAHIYYEDNEVNTIGAFKSIDGFDWREGYLEWATHADSLINGKMKYKSLDSSYAMKKVRVGPPFWTGKRIFRAMAFTLSATSLGLGIWQDRSVNSKTKSANKLYKETLEAAIGDEGKLHSKKANDYNRKVDSMHDSQLARNGFYISAGVFGVAGIMSFCF